MEEWELEIDYIIDEMNRKAPGCCKGCENLYYDDGGGSYGEKTDIIYTWCVEYDEDCYKAKYICKKIEENIL